MSVASDRVALAERLTAAGFSYEDARAFVGRLADTAVLPDLAWHDREAQWFAAGPPSGWSPAQRAEVNAHYLTAHFVDPMFLLTTYGRQGGTTPPVAVKSNTGVWIAGLAFVALVGGAAWIAGRK